MAAPGSLPAHLQYGLIATQERRYQMAAAELRKVTEIDPTSYEGWSALSAAYERLHEDDLAKECAERAAELDPSTRTAKLVTLTNLKRAGKLSQAKVELKRLLTTAPPLIAEDLGREALAIGAFDEAIEA